MTDLAGRRGNWRACEGFVFVVTYGRSGSTVLLNLLNAIDGYCIRGENNNALLPLYQAWATVLQSPNLRQLRKRGQVTSPEHPWFGGELVRPKAFRDGLVKTFCEEILALPPRTRVAGFKEIRYPRDAETFNGYLDFMAVAFPEAKFIFNSRNHAAVARSGWFAEQPERAVRARLEKSEALFSAYAARHPERCHSLVYDDWKGRPEALRPLFAFLDEPFDPDRVGAVLNTRLTHMQRTKSVDPSED